MSHDRWVKFWRFAEIRMNLHAAKVRWQLAEVLSHSESRHILFLAPQVHSKILVLLILSTIHDLFRNHQLELSTSPQLTGPTTRLELCSYSTVLSICLHSGNAAVGQTESILVPIFIGLICYPARGELHYQVPKSIKRSCVTGMALLVIFLLCFR